MTSGLEDKIIAYFDGELSDADSAELLHRVSVSPEIRDLFREHEMLRGLAHEATRSAAIRPEIESSLFSKIEAIASKPSREKPMFIFSRRTAMALALALILISGSLGYFVPKLFSGNSSETALGTIAKPLEISQAIVPSEPSKEIASLLVENRSYETHKSYKTYRSHGTYLTDGNTAQNENISQPVKVESQESQLSEISPIASQAEDIQSNIGSQRHSPFERQEFSSDSRQLFDISLQTSSGFSYPADRSSVKPFADQRLSFAYHLSENNLIGIRIASGLYQQLNTAFQTSSNGATYITRSMKSKRSFSEEVFISHLVPITFSAPFFLQFSVDAGLIPNGYSLGAEIGIRIPLSENIMFDGAFALSRVHSNVLTSDELLNSESSGKPIVLSGPEISTTLNGRLHYGLLYRF